MDPQLKSDWPEARRRWEAWWQGEIIDRVVIQAIAPLEPLPDTLALHLNASADAAFFHLHQHSALPGGYLGLGSELSQEEIERYFTDPEGVLEREERALGRLFYGGEAFPVVHPVSINLVAISAAYLGSPYHIHPGSRTGWADPIVDDWRAAPPLTFRRDTPWWRTSERLLRGALGRAGERYAVSLPDLNAPGEILSRLRGSERLCLDLIDDPESVQSALEQITSAWLEMWKECAAILSAGSGGHVYWMGIWSERPSIDLQCDFSALISPEMFRRFIVPSLERQIRDVERTIYHVDGPDALQHLDALLELPGLTGIQWVSGAGAPSAPAWLPQLKRIQQAGKRLVLYCYPDEVEGLLVELEPEGLLLGVGCSTPQQARALISSVERWTARRSHR